MISVLSAITHLKYFGIKFSYMIRDFVLHSILQKSAELAHEVADKSRWGIFFAPILIFIERYIFSDWPFLIWLLVLIVLDTLLGFGFAVSRRQVSPGKLAGIFIKFVVYGSLMILGHVLENFKVSDEAMPGGYYFKMVIYAGVIIVEAISIMRNLGKINKKLVPKFILKRFEGFNESGDFNELTGKPVPKNTDFQSPHGDDFLEHIDPEYRRKDDPRRPNDQDHAADY